MTQLRERAEKLEYDDVAIPHADEPLGQATVFPIVQQEEKKERESGTIGVNNKAKNIASKYVIV